MHGAHLKSFTMNDAEQLVSVCVSNATNHDGFSSFTIMSFLRYLGLPEELMDKPMFFAAPSMIEAAAGSENLAKAVREFLGNWEEYMGSRSKITPRQLSPENLPWLENKAWLTIRLPTRKNGAAIRELLLNKVAKPEVWAKELNVKLPTYYDTPTDDEMTLDFFIHEMVAYIQNAVGPFPTLLFPMQHALLVEGPHESRVARIWAQDHPSVGFMSWKQFCSCVGIPETTKRLREYPSPTSRKSAEAEKLFHQILDIETQHLDKSARILNVFMSSVIDVSDKNASNSLYELSDKVFTEFYTHMEEILQNPLSDIKKSIQTIVDIKKMFFRVTLKDYGTKLPLDAAHPQPAQDEIRFIHGKKHTAMFDEMRELLILYDVAHTRYHLGQELQDIVYDYRVTHDEYIAGIVNAKGLENAETALAYVNMYDHYSLFNRHEKIIEIVDDLLEYIVDHDINTNVDLRNAMQNQGVPFMLSQEIENMMIVNGIALPLTRANLEGFLEWFRRQPHTDWETLGDVCKNLVADIHTAQLARTPEPETDLVASVQSRLREWYYQRLTAPIMDKRSVLLFVDYPEYRPKHIPQPFTYEYLKDLMVSNEPDLAHFLTTFRIYISFAKSNEGFLAYPMGARSWEDTTDFINEDCMEALETFRMQVSSWSIMRKDFSDLYRKEYESELWFTLENKRQSLKEAWLQAYRTKLLNRLRSDLTAFLRQNA